MNFRKNISLFVVLFLAGSITIVYAFNRHQQKHPETPIDIRKELQLLYENAHKDSLEIKGVISMYDQQNGKPIEIAPFLYLKCGQNLYSQLGPVNTFSDGRVTVRVDTAQKAIYVQAASSANAVGVPMDIGSFLNDSTTLNSISYAHKDSLNELVFRKTNNPSLDQYQILYDTMHHQIKEMTLHWNRRDVLGEKDVLNKLLISKVICSYNVLPKIEDRYRISSVISVNNGQVQTTTAFHSYQVHVF